MQNMSDAAYVHKKRKLHENIYTACVAEVYRTGGGCTAYAAIPGAIQVAKREDRAGICRCKREARHAVHATPRSVPSYKMGQAQICCDEPEKTGHVEVAGWETWHVASYTCVFITTRYKNAWIRLMESMYFSTVWGVYQNDTPQDSEVCLSEFIFERGIDNFNLSVFSQTIHIFLITGMKISGRVGGIGFIVFFF